VICQHHHISALTSECTQRTTSLIHERCLRHCLRSFASHAQEPTATRLRTSPRNALMLSMDALLCADSSAIPRTAARALKRSRPCVLFSLPRPLNSLVSRMSQPRSVIPMEVVGGVLDKKNQRTPRKHLHQPHLLARDQLQHVTVALEAFGIQCLRRHIAPPRPFSQSESIREGNATDRPGLLLQLTTGTSADWVMDPTLVGPSGFHFGLSEYRGRFASAFQSST